MKRNMLQWSLISKRYLIEEGPWFGVDEKVVSESSEVWIQSIKNGVGDTEKMNETEEEIATFFFYGNRLRASVLVNHYIAQMLASDDEDDDEEENWTY